MNLYRKNQTTTVKDFTVLPAGGDVPLGLELIERAAKDINTAFFVDLFLLIHNRTASGGGTPTAMEIEQLAQEKSFLLAPILVNQQQENFDKLFERVFEVMRRRRVIPAPPRKLTCA